MINQNKNYGGYRNLKSYQMATLIYDLTMEFCKHYIRQGSRTRDQMEQAARSGQKNIAEGSKVARTSRKSELKLVNIARGSLEELLGDYEDFLRQNNLEQWDKDDPRAKAIRVLAYQMDGANRTDKTYRTNGADRIYKSYLENPEKAANALICLINQANYLLDRQIQTLEKDLVEKGDINYKQMSYKDKLLAKMKEDDEWLAEQIRLIKENTTDKTNETDRTNRTDRTDF